MYFKQNIFNIHIKISPFIIIFQYMCFSLYHPFQYILHTNKFIHIIVRIFSLLHILSNLPSHTYRHILISMRLCAIAHYIKGQVNIQTLLKIHPARDSSIRFFLIIIIIIIVVIIAHISFSDFFPSFLLLCVQRSQLNTIFIGLQAHHLTDFITRIRQHPPPFFLFILFNLVHTSYNTRIEQFKTIQTVCKGMWKEM